MSVKYPTKEDCRKVFAEVMEALNTFSDEQVANAFYEELVNSHRTLQQNFWRSVAHMIKEYAKNEYYDLRNEDSVNWCKKMAEVEDQYFRCV